MVINSRKEDEEPLKRLYIYIIKNNQERILDQWVVLRLSGAVLRESTMWGRAQKDSLTGDSHVDMDATTTEKRGLR